MIVLNDEFLISTSSPRGTEIRNHSTVHERRVSVYAAKGRHNHSG